MYALVNKNLHELYEKLNNKPFVTEDSTPNLVCYFCCTKLKQSYHLLKKCLGAKDRLAQMMDENYKPQPLVTNGQLDYCSRLIRSPIEVISIDDKPPKETVVIKEELSEVCDEIIEPKKEIQVMMVSFQAKFSVNVWAGVIGRTLIGPHILPDNLNGENYLNFLQNDLPTLLDDAEVPILNTDRPIIFQQDGCPSHWTLIVREHLDNCFPGSWIGRDGPIPWPARSLDLTPLDFFVWGRAKELVYTTEISTREELIQRIEAAFRTMKEEMQLKITTTEVRNRCRKCIRCGGSHFEHQN